MIESRTKIVATVGPASWAPTKLRALLAAGVDVFRLNFSHGDRPRHAQTIAAIRAAERAAGRAVAILADLQGPRIRVGILPGDGERLLRRGERIDLGGSGLPLTYARLAAEVRPGHRILIADGEIELRVVRTSGARAECVVVVGGRVRSRKGINVPDTAISLGTLTAKDRADLAFAAEHGVDFVGVSFVGSAADLRRARSLLRRAGSHAALVAKIEREVAIRNLDEILDETDAVMVARGDLAVEVGYENVPVLQKRILREANARGVPSITATQMLESMTEHPHPTRAEASDVANALFDGTDAVMLSGETAAGRYPLAAVRAMARIVARTERALAAHGFPCAPATARAREEGAIARAAVRTAADIGARCIAPCTRTGRTAQLVSRERPTCPIVALAESERAARRLALAWGANPRRMATRRTIAAQLAAAERALLAGGDARRGDRVIFLAGASALPGGAHTLRVHVCGRD